MSELLSKEQFAEIEHRKPYQYGTMVRLTVAERDALCAQLHEVEAERSHYREALNAIAIKKYDNWAFGEVVGLAKRTIESLPERQTWCDHCSADLNGVKHILCDKDYQLFAKALYDVEKVQGASDRSSAGARQQVRRSLHALPNRVCPRATPISPRYQQRGGPCHARFKVIRRRQNGRCVHYVHEPSR